MSSAPQLAPVPIHPPAQRRPETGDRVRADVALSTGESRQQWITLMDGSMVITPDQILAFGGGDLKLGRRELRNLLAAERDRKIHRDPATRPASVRVATEADVQDVFDLIMLDLRENAVLVAPIDEEKVRRTIHIAITGQGGPRGFACVINGPDAKPVAVGLVIPMQWWWSNQWFLQETINYVHPDHRRSHHIDDLLEFERFAADSFTRNFGYRTYMLFGILGWKRVRAKIALYRRKLAMTGAAFLYPSPFGNEE